MLNISKIKSGKNIVVEGEPYKVLYDEHSKMGRAGAVLRTKLKNLATGAVLEKTFQGADKVNEADVEKTYAQYLYQDGDEQFSLPKKVIGDLANYLVEGVEVTIINFNGSPINIELPAKVTLTVTDAPPGIKGDTASSGDKLVTVETGAKITTPLFINEGDKIIVNTDKGEYVSRA
ncbi:MAG: Elongation factor P [Candidatus Moranbacteria bacterium GW2011_GWF2_35_54]|nr:MAG: Elongation factor P [Candidatus Moranbacteria bacterium GW2011_GWF2_35_54]